jgi:hypothetical protein
VHAESSLRLSILQPPRRLREVSQQQDGLSTAQADGSQKKSGGNHRLGLEELQGAERHHRNRIVICEGAARHKVEFLAHRSYDPDRYAQPNTIISVSKSTTRVRSFQRQGLTPSAGLRPD